MAWAMHAAAISRRNSRKRRFRPPAEGEVMAGAVVDARRANPVAHGRRRPLRTADLRPGTRRELGGVGLCAGAMHRLTGQRRLRLFGLRGPSRGKQPHRLPLRARLRANRPQGAFFALAILPLDKLVDAATRDILRRFAAESALGNFGVYFGDETERQSPSRRAGRLSAMKFSLFVHMERLDAGAGPATSSTRSSSRSARSPTRAACTRSGPASITAWTSPSRPTPSSTSPIWRGAPSNVRLGTGTVVAPFWHPIKLAGEAAMTDIISDGRLDIGIARGAYSFEYERLLPGLDAWGAGQRMRETDPRGEEALGRRLRPCRASSGQFPSTTSAPKPIQQPHPPIWVAARDPNSHEFAVANGCNVQVTPLWHRATTRLQALMARFNAACAKHPRDRRGRRSCCCGTPMSAPTRPTSRRPRRRSASTTTTSSPGSRTSGRSTRG